MLSFILGAVSFLVMAEPEELFGSTGHVFFLFNDKQILL